MKYILFFIVVILSYSSVKAEESDSLKFFPPLSQEISAAAPGNQIPYLQYGFKLGFNIPLSKEFTNTLKAKNSLSAEFGIYARAGKYVYGEIGFGYTFYKNTFQLEQDSTMYESFEEIVELRYLQIPIKIVGNIKLSDNITFQPFAGFIYQPLIGVSDNVMGHSKNTLSRHPFFFTGGLGIKVYFITLDIAYRQSLTTYFHKKASKKPSFINILLGFQF